MALRNPRQMLKHYSAPHPRPEKRSELTPNMPEETLPGAMFENSSLAHGRTRPKPAPNWPMLLPNLGQQ